MKKVNSASVRRATRIRKKIKAGNHRLRLSVHRSNRYIDAQIIDDKKCQTITFCRQKELVNEKGGEKLTKTETAYKVGLLLAKKAIEKKITEVVFDRGKYKYHGRIKALAEGARKGGLIF